ncbi:MAG: sulfite exporter TauE/SafE family protein [Spirochaetaceae bacterium]
MEDILSYIFPAFTANYSGITLFLVLAGLGIGVGLLAGLFGVGGGFLLVPLMNIALGIPIEVAGGSATCYIIGTSSTGFIKQLKNGNVEFKVFLFIAMGSSIGAILGDVLQNFLLSSVANGNQAYFEQITLTVFFILLIIIAGIMFFTPHERSDKKLLLQKFPIGPRVDLVQSGINGLSISGLILIGLIGGILTGLLGISGGVLFTPLLVLGVGLAGSVATGTSLGVVLVASVVAVIKKGFSGPGKISLGIALSLLIASAIGIQTGIRIGQKLHAAKLKKYFAIVVLLAAAMVLYKLI